MKHSMEKADHNVFFIADVKARTRTKMLGVPPWSSPVMTKKLMKLSRKMMLLLLHSYTAEDTYNRDVSSTLVIFYHPLLYSVPCTEPRHPKLSIVTVHKAEPLLVQINLTQFRKPGGDVATVKDAKEVDVDNDCIRKPLILQYRKGLMLENTKNLRYSARDRRLKLAQLDVKKSRLSSYSTVAVPCQEIWIGARVNIRS